MAKIASWVEIFKPEPYGCTLRSQDLHRSTLCAEIAIATDARSESIECLTLCRARREEGEANEND